MPADDRRKRPRIAAMLLCEIEGTDLPSRHARVRDFNERGMRIACKAGLAPDSRVRVRLPGSQAWVSARVAWCQGGVAGLCFMQPVVLPRVPTRRVAQPQ